MNSADTTTALLGCLMDLAELQRQHNVILWVGMEPNGVRIQVSDHWHTDKKDTAEAFIRSLCSETHNVIVRPGKPDEWTQLVGVLTDSVTLWCALR